MPDAADFAAGRRSDIRRQAAVTCFDILHHSALAAFAETLAG